MRFTLFSHRKKSRRIGRLTGADTKIVKGLVICYRLLIRLIKWRARTGAIERFSQIEMRIKIDDANVATFDVWLLIKRVKTG